MPSTLRSPVGPTLFDLQIPNFEALPPPSSLSSLGSCRVQLEPGRYPHLEQTALHSPNRRSPAPAPRPDPTTEERPPLSCATTRIRRPAEIPLITVFNVAQSALPSLICRSQSSRHGHCRPVFWAPRRVQLEPGRYPHLEQTVLHSPTRSSPAPPPRPGWAGPTTRGFFADLVLAQQASTATGALQFPWTYSLISRTSAISGCMMSYTRCCILFSASSR